MKSQTTKKVSKYLSTPPQFSLYKDKKTGLWICKFTLDGKYSRSTGERNERLAKPIAKKIRDNIWEDWKLSGLSQSTPPVSPSIAPPVSIRDRAQTVGIGIKAVSQVKQIDSLEVPKVVKVPCRETIKDSLQMEIPCLSSITINVAAKQFLEYYANDHNDRHTKSSVGAVGGFLQMFQVNFPYIRMEEISLVKLQYFQRKAEKYWAKRTVQSLITYIKKFLKWALSKGHVANDFPEFEFNKNVAYGGKTVDKKSKWDKDLFFRFIKHYDLNDQMALQVGWNTGIDLCDIALITKDTLVWNEDEQIDYIQMIRLKAKDKSDTSREVICFPVVGELKRLVEWGLAHGKKYLFNPLYEEAEGEEYDSTEFTKRIGNKRSLIFQTKYPNEKAMGFKRLRHTFYSNARKMEIPDHVLMKWGGWVDTTMLNRIYDVNTETGKWVKMLGNKTIVQMNPDQRRLKMA